MGGRARGAVSRVSGAGEAGIFPSSMIARRSRLLEQAAWCSQGAGTKVASITGQWAAEAWGPGEGQGAWRAEVGRFKSSVRFSNLLKVREFIHFDSKPVLLISACYGIPYTHKIHNKKVKI